jgi:chaperonin GroES
VTDIAPDIYDEAPDDLFDADGSVVPLAGGAGGGLGRLEKSHRSDGDISEHLTDAQLTEIGADVVSDWRMDRETNTAWRETAERALDAAAQEGVEPKEWPWAGAANVRYPLMTIANLQFAARAYPAIVKGDEAVRVKTFGRDPQGKKQKRAQRVADFLNYMLFYVVEDWEADTDAMLHRLPTVGQHYRKVYFDQTTGKPCIESVSALRLTIPADARSLKASPRITHDFDRYPYELQAMMAKGDYRRVTLTPDSKGERNDDQAARLLLEQHRMMDLDNDGLDEPYIVTVDEASMQVLRIEEAFSDSDVEENDDGEITRIKRWMPFVDYSFIPDPKGRAYSIGFGHLITPMMDVINTTINQMLDAGTAQVAGGGFVGSELRLSGAGNNGSLRFSPGEYKTVLAGGADIRNGIYERTFPAPSPVLFQLLGMLMEAAKDIASVNDAITGDAARTAPVGTTLALIEQGQQVFNAIYKRIYRALREEFKLFQEIVRRYCSAEQYARFCDVEPEAVAPDAPSPPEQGMMVAPQQPGMVPPQPQPIDPEVLFREDFDPEDLDIRPVSDPSSVTKMQQMGKLQFALSFLQAPGIYDNPRAVVREALQVAGIEQAEEWISEQPPAPPPPTPLQLHDMAQTAELKDAQAQRLRSEATLSAARAAEIAHNNTGEQSNTKVMLDQAKAQHLLADSAQKAGGMIANLEQLGTGAGG